MDWAQDAFQAGCIGLIRGLQSWDYTKGYALSTYVSWHIRAQIQRWRWNEVALIRLPVHVWEQMEYDSDRLSAAIEVAALRALDIVPLEDVKEDDLSLAWDGGIEEINRHVEMRRLVRPALYSSNRAGGTKSSSSDMVSVGISDGPMTLDAIGQILRGDSVSEFVRSRTRRLRS